MCHILYIERTKGKKVIDKKALLSRLLSSDKQNNDGMGYLLLKKDDHEIKRHLKTTIEDYIKVVDKIDKLKRGERIIIHTRFATQGGISLENTQPCEVGSKVLIHNGHFSKFYDTKKSDTLMACESLNRLGIEPFIDSLKEIDGDYEDTIDNKLYNKYGIDRYDYGYDSLESTYPYQTKGGNNWYSMFIYDKKTKELVYTKSDSTTFNTITSGGYKIGYTSTIDFVPMGLFKGISEPKADIIYDLTIKNK